MTSSGPRNYHRAKLAGQPIIYQRCLSTRLLLENCARKEFSLIMTIDVALLIINWCLIEVTARNSTSVFTRSRQIERASLQKNFRIHAHSATVNISRERSIESEDRSINKCLCHVRQPQSLKMPSGRSIIGEIRSKITQKS